MMKKSPLSSNKSQVIILFALLVQLNIGKLETQASHWRPARYSSEPIGHQADSFITTDRSLFLASKGSIYKYDQYFKVLQSYTIHAEKDDSINKFLLILDTPDKGLITCWQNKNFTLQCDYHYRLNDLKQRKPLRLPSTYKTNEFNFIRALVTSQRNVILITSNSPDRIKDSFNNTKAYLPAISRFTLSISPPNSNNLSLQEESVLSYKHDFGSIELYYSYIYAFEFGEHIYFVLDDIKKTRSNSITNQVKLARICIGDNDLTSYTEILLSCDNKQNLKPTAAFFNGSSKLDNPSSLDGLIIASESTSNTLSPETNHMTRAQYICSYSITHIQEYFDKVITECNRPNHQYSSLLTKFTRSDSIQYCEQNNNPDLCSSKTNQFIDGSKIAVQDEHLISRLLISSTITFLHVLEQGTKGRKILFLGTESGMLMKLTDDGQELYTIDTISKLVNDGGLTGSDHQLYQDRISRINPPGSNSNLVAKYALMNDQNIFINIDETLHRIETDTCRLYSCTGCLRHIDDPLNCGWCGDTCKSRAETCFGGFVTSCPPIIYDISPKAGPFSGKTKLKIEGENFGSRKAVGSKLKVLLKDRLCEVDITRSNNHVIECLTPTFPSSASTTAMDATITVDVNDEDGDITLIGNATNFQTHFTYKTVKVFGLHPIAGQLGPIGSTDSTIIRVYGQNLEIGSECKILIGKTECNIIERETSVVKCNLNIHNNNESQVELRSGQKGLHLYIDDSEQTIEPRSSINNTLLSINYTLIQGESTSQPMTTYSESGISNISIIVMVLSFIIFSIFLAFIFKNDNILLIKKWLRGNAAKSKDDQAREMDVLRTTGGEFTVGGAGADTVTTNIKGLLKREDDHSFEPDHYNMSTTDQLSNLRQPLFSQYLDEDTMKLVIENQILIDVKRITLTHPIGSGQFGKVFKGFMKQDDGQVTKVAVKTLHSRPVWEGFDCKAFVKEGLMMSDFDHPNVLCLIGLSFDRDGLPMVITPYMHYGDLRSYISDESSSPTVKELIDYGTQVAKGMAYLSELKFVHRDLAARNCMLDDNLVVKVADFGLSRDIYQSDYYYDSTKKTKLPVKWMALESLERAIYTTKTDVWSYGVLLWELMTRGVVPYPDVDNYDMRTYLRDGRRMLKPLYCPILLYKIMLSCWEEDPEKRPSFQELVISVSSVITELMVAKDGQEKVGKDETYSDAPKYQPPKVNNNLERL